MLRIAIDGTASAGKGSIAKGVARALNIAYVDTGAMYRSIALLVLEANKDCHSMEDVLSVLDDVSFGFSWNGNSLGCDLSTEEKSQHLSAPKKLERWLVSYLYILKFDRNSQQFSRLMRVRSLW